MQRTLIIICEDDEGNAKAFYDRCQDLKIPCRLLQDSEMGRDWIFTQDSETLSPRILDFKQDKVYALDDEKYCFHFRSPHFSSQENLRVAYTYLVECLYTVSYESGLFLHSLKAFDFDQCKPQNLSLSPGLRVPKTTITNDHSRLLEADKDSIVKGMSIIRTQAVTLSDPTLNLSSEDVVQFQERIRGKDLKIIAYRRRDGGWEILPTVMEPKQDKVDYRFDGGNEIRLFKEDFPWQKYAEDIYQRSGIRFFDFDFKFTADHELVFLEVNPGACGISEELAINDPTIHFSKRMLEDFCGQSPL